MADKGSPSGLDKSTEAAFASAFDAMKEWRDEISNSTKTHGEQVFEKLGKAAKAAGWPPELIESTKQQLIQTADSQVQMMDQVISVWRETARSAAEKTDEAKGALTQPADFAAIAMAPTQIWLQTMDLWRKSWADALARMTGGNLQK